MYVSSLGMESRKTAYTKFMCNSRTDNNKTKSVYILPNGQEKPQAPCPTYSKKKKKMPLRRSRAKGVQKLCTIEGLCYADMPFFS